MYERFTDRARKVMQLANQEAQRFNHEYVGTEHVLLGLVKEGSGIAANVLKNMDIDLKKVRREVDKLVLSGPEIVTMGKLPQTPRAKQVILFAMEEARRLHHDYVGTEHLLLGLLREGEGIAAQVLLTLGASLQAMREEVIIATREMPSDFAVGRFGAQPGLWKKARRLVDTFFGSAAKASLDSLADETERADVYERFTDRVREALQLADHEAQRFNHKYVGTEHILLGIIAAKRGVATLALEALGVNLRRLRHKIESLVESGPEVIQTIGKLPLTIRGCESGPFRAIEYAREEARGLNHDYIGTEHLLLGLLRERDGLASEALLAVGVELQKLREAVLEVLANVPAEIAAAREQMLQARPKTVEGDDEPVAPRDAQAVLRILDASANRAAEGLRVVEDYLRFVLDDAAMTEEVKQIRHELAAALQELGRESLVAARDVLGDVGTEIKTAAEGSRGDAEAVLEANFARAVQALRSLGEYGKVLSPESAGIFEALRYQVYMLESRLLAARDHRGKLLAARLYILVDGGASREAFLVLVDQLLAAGVHAIQLRDKRLADRELVERARTLRRRIRHFDARTLFIMNDRPDLAVLTDADGVHVGKEELSVADARRIVGGKRLVGVSTHSIEQARAAMADGASYIGVGPAFPSQTKEFESFPGLPPAGYVARELRIPAFAIGGITLENLPQVLATGIERVAVGAAITQSSDPGSEVRRWLEALSS